MMTAQYQSALQSYAEGRYEEAMQQFSELLHEDPRNPKLHIWLGATFRKAGKIEYAKVQYQQVLTLTDDPDLLDLASTSLAQIQNKLANAAQGSAPFKKLSKDLDNPPNNKPLQPQVVQNGSSKTNGFSGNGRSLNQSITPDENVTTSDSTLLAPPSIKSDIKSKTPINTQGNSAGLVPPPPAIASLLKDRQQENKQKQASPQSQQMQTQQMPIEQVVIKEDTTESSTSSILNETIASIHEVNQTTKKTKKGKSQVKSPPLEGVLFSESDKNNRSQKVFKTSRNPNTSKSSPIALEDMFKFSSVGQKITLWGTLLATIPAIALGITAYQVGGGLLLNKVKQGQQSEAIALAKATGSFLRQKTAEVDMFKKLLGSSTEVGQNLTTSNLTETNKTMKPLSSLPIAQQRQYKQQLTNRLNLYSQAYPQYSSIAIFSISGEFLAQSNNSKTLQTLNPNSLNKVTAGDGVLISNPIVGKEGAYFYAVTSVKSSISQQASMILQIEIPVKSLVSELANTRTTNTGSSNFYVIDSANKYIASSQPIAIGEDVSADLAMLSDLRSAQAPDVRDVVRSDRNEQIIAYASVPNMQSYGVLNWDVLTTLDKATAISANQNLLLVIGSGIALTPLLVSAIAYALTRQLVTRLKDIRSALRDLRKGATDHSFRTFSGTLSVKGNDELADISLSINKMSEQFHVMSQKQEQEKQRMQLQVVKMFKVLSKLAREEKQEVSLEVDLSDENILLLGKKIRAEMVQRNAEVKSYQKQKEDLQGQLMQMLKEMQALADGDLTISSKAIEGDLSDVGIFFDDVMRGLQNIVGQVKSSANQVNFSLGQNEQAIANLTSISQRQVDTVTRSLNSAQMFKVSATTITNNSQQVIQSSQMIAKKILDSDHSINAVMEKVGELQSTVSTTAKRVKHLGEASQKIAKAISAINEIAIKTNFLAINATLEAARTGDMGNGFVMVAEEVGELASRSVAATKEVEALLGSIQNETKAVMAAVESGSNQVTASNTLAIAAKDSLQQIAEISQQIDHLVSSISDATISQVQTSEGVANLMKDISHIAKRNLTSSSEVSKFLKVTKQHSGDLQQSLTHFKTR